MTDGALTGKAVAIIGIGDDVHRALAVACAEAGAAVALGTVDPSQEQEYAVNSIANEVWAIGVEHFAQVMDAADIEQIGAFVTETWARLGRCDALLAAHRLTPEGEADPRRRYVVTRRAPLLAAQAFGSRMQEQGSGAVVFVDADRDAGDAKALNVALQAHVGAGGPRLTVVGREAADPRAAAAAALAIVAPGA